MKRGWMVLGMVLIVTVILGVGNARADKLDDIIKSGHLRCGCMLDFPPAGFRDANNQPAGFDVDTCKEIAKALNVKADIVETQAPQRIPALTAGTVDVVVASTTATLERAKSVTFTIPYMVYTMSVVVPENSPIKSFDQLRGKSVAVVRGTTPETEYLKRCKDWPEGCKNISVGSNAEQILALRQGRVQAMVEASSFVGTLVKSAQGKGLKIACDMPGYTDWVSIMVPRGDYGFRDWLNLFIFHQVDSGNYAELYKKWFGAEKPPALTVNGVYW
jgi:ABC-type amino acid transport substrate-binding protein